MTEKESLQYQKMAPIVGDLLVRDSFLDVTLGLAGLQGQWSLDKAKKKLSHAVEQLLRAAKGQLRLAPPGLQDNEVRKGRDVYEFVGVTLDKVDPEAEHDITKKWLQEHLRGFKTNFRRAAEIMARFPEGDPVDVPTYLREHGNEEGAQSWEVMHDTHKDNFTQPKTAGETGNMSTMDELKKLAGWEAGHRTDEEEIPEGEGSLIPGLEDRRGSTIIAFVEACDDMDEELVLIPGDEMMAVVEPGTGACEHMDDTDCAKWNANTEQYKDVVKDKHQAGVVPGIPDGTGPHGETPGCPMFDEDDGSGDEMMAVVEPGEGACEHMDKDRKSVV